MSDGLCQCGCGNPAPLAQRTDKRHGWVRGQPLRFINGHNKRRTPNDYAEEDRGYDTPCWIWQRWINNKGYGICRRGGQNHAAHRWYYEQKWGELPDDIELDHLCRVRECVNPAHLEPVSPAENRQRGLNAKLTPANVRQIRASSLSDHALAQMYGVHPRAIYDVRSGARWSNVT